MLNLVGLQARYKINQSRLERPDNIPPIIKGIIKLPGQIYKSYNKIKELTDDLFRTGDIQTIDYCLEVYWQFMNNEEFDPFLWNDWEIKKTLIKLKPQLEKFRKNIDKLYIKLVKFIKFKSPSNFEHLITKGPYEIKEIFIEDLKK